MLTPVEKAIFILAVLTSLYFAVGTFKKMVAIIGSGSGEIPRDRMLYRCALGVKMLINQNNMIRNRPFVSLVHSLIAWTFILYLLVNVVDVLEGLITNFHFLGSGLTGDIYHFLVDVMSVMALIGMTYFLVRRFLSKSPALNIRDNIKLHPAAIKGISKDSLLVGLFILGHIGFRFLSASFQIAQEGGDTWQPFANILASVWMGLPPFIVLSAEHIFWWLAIGLILVFLPYFPHTKHAHLFMGPFNLATKPDRKSPGAMDAIDFEDESIEQFGISQLKDLSQTQLVDAFACIMCNRCQDACPAYTTGKELSPSALEINKRYHISENMNALADGKGDDVPLLSYAISESALWACTSCGACVEVCPVGNEPMLDILGIRQDQVLMNSAFPNELKGAFTGIERNGNPWQMSGDRMAWTESLDFVVPTTDDNPEYDLLYWVGCAGAYDPGTQKTARAIATILNTAGVNFAVLGNSETCTGDMARRAGNEYLFSEMAKSNIETLNGAGAQKKKIVTGCPHCFHTLDNEYPAYGGQYDVMHHTQLIDNLITEGKIKPESQDGTEITYHDPCFLGRHNGEYNAPRDALTTHGFSLVEMARNKRDSFCCGAGGAQVWKEEEAGDQAVSDHRFEEAKKTGVETLAVGCPFCARMMNDANARAGSPMQIKDIAEIVAESSQKEKGTKQGN
jgi:Fe-S oxidoreductase